MVFKHEFPVIETIHDVLPFVKGRKDILVMEKQNYTVIDYVIQTPETFSGDGSEYKVECRGLVFDEQGVLISRPYHKFFNLNEREETQEHRVPLHEKHILMHKEDGSMVRPVLFGDGFRFMTRKGITNIAMRAETFLVQQDYKYIDWILHQLRAGYTPIFEYVGPNNRIVLRYDYEDLILTGLRHIHTGEYVPMQDIDTPFNVVIFSEGADLERLKTIQQEVKDFEGVVVRFADGHMLKVKTQWYVDIHRAKSGIEDEYGIVKAYLTGALDDISAFLMEDDKKRVNGVVHTFNVMLDNVLAEAIALYQQYEELGRKQFALDWGGKVSPLVFQAVMGMFSGRTPTLDFVKEKIVNSKAYFKKNVLPLMEV